MTVTTPVVPAPRCAVAAGLRGDPMAGSAAPAAGFLLVEQPGGWGRQALTSSRLDPPGRCSAVGPRHRGGAAGAADPPSWAAPGAGTPVLGRGQRPARSGGDLVGRVRCRRRAAQRCRWTAAPGPGRPSPSTWCARTGGTTSAARSRAARWPRRCTGCGRARSGSARTSAVTGSPPTSWRCRTASTTAGSSRPGSRTWSPRTSGPRCCRTWCAAGRPRCPRRRRRSPTSVVRRARCGSRRWLRPGSCTSAPAAGRSGSGPARTT